MDAHVEAIAPKSLTTVAKDAFNGLDTSSLTTDNFLDLVSACGSKCIGKCPNELPTVEVEGFLMEMAAQLWSDRKLSGRCPLRDLLSRLRVSSEFGPRECAFMTKYFYYFGKMRSHEGMMNDIGRSETYRKAIMGNPDNFKDKVIMDVGSGSGLLAFFAIQAGAKKVYAVEAGCMHEVIGMLARANGWGDKVVVINKVLQDMTEDDCPLNSVDTMVAETLGTFLFGERGIETMLVARDRFLKPGGAIFPTQATLSIQPFSDSKLFDQQNTRSIFWSGADFMGINLSTCYERAQVEQMSQVVASMVDEQTLVATQHDVVYDFRTLNSAALRNIHLKYNFAFDKDAEVHGLAGWFIADFIGANQTTSLSTAPQDTLTHWFQVRFMIPKPLSAHKGDSLIGTMDMMANEQQTYTCAMEMTLGDERRQNSDMSLMDLDSSLKQHSYKIVKHGEVSVACVDWEKTTAEARALRNPSKLKMSKNVAEQISFLGKTFICVNLPERYHELKLKNLATCGKIGDEIVFLSAVGDVETRGGLIRREAGTGEESFWMEKSVLDIEMIEVIVSKKKMLQGEFAVKADDQVRKHFEQLTSQQVADCFQALTAP